MLSSGMCTVVEGINIPKSATHIVARDNMIPTNACSPAKPIATPISNTVLDTSPATNPSRVLATAPTALDPKARDEAILRWKSRQPRAGPTNHFKANPMRNPGE